MYELLAQKFQLFEGVFGASDEVLGAIGSGVDFERRIADIYQNCRDPSEIKASFEQLQLDLSGEINEAMVKTRQILLENFDEEVQDKLRVRAEDSRSARSCFERMLMGLTRAELGDCASFDNDGFNLRRAPDGIAASGLSGIELGRYELPRRSGDAHLYRINHPLALWITQQAKSRALDGAKLVFDYDGYGTKVSTLALALAREACLRAFEWTITPLDGWEPPEAEGAPETRLRALVHGYLSVNHRDHPGEGCPAAALAADAARAGPEMSKVFAQGVERNIQRFMSVLPGNDGAKRARTIATLSSMVGALVLARATAAGDPALSEEILATLREQLAP